MWSKPLLCRFQRLGEIPQMQVPQGFPAFCLALPRIPPRHSQTRRAANCATPRLHPDIITDDCAHVQYANCFNLQELCSAQIPPWQYMRPLQLFRYHGKKYKPHQLQTQSCFDCRMDMRCMPVSAYNNPILSVYCIVCCCASYPRGIFP